LLQDVDDTIFPSSAGGVDLSWFDKVPYPGLRTFLKECCEQELAFVASARPIGEDHVSSFVKSAISHEGYRPSVNTLLGRKLSILNVVGKYVYASVFGPSPSPPTPSSSSLASSPASSSSPLAVHDGSSQRKPNDSLEAGVAPVSESTLRQKDAQRAAFYKSFSEDKIVSVAKLMEAYPVSACGFVAFPAFLPLHFPFFLGVFETRLCGGEHWGDPMRSYV
jgi:hypothetical protein